jgi:hypothetical protein
LYFPEDNPKQLDRNETFVILDQTKPPVWHNALVDANVDNFEIFYEESDSYFKCLELLK